MADIENIKVKILTKPDQRPEFVNSLSISFTYDGCFIDFGFIDPANFISTMETLNEESIISAEPVGRFVMSFDTTKKLLDLLNAHFEKFIRIEEVSSETDNIERVEARNDE